MRQVDASTAESYLRDRGALADAEQPRIGELAGGVSNLVLRIELGEAARDFVLKQARPQLRTPQAWFCEVNRIWREVEVLRFAAQVAPAHVPRLLFEDRENFLYAMSAAPRAHRTWRDELLAGTVEIAIARQCGELLGALHARTWHRPEVASAVGDQRYFRELRLDPYYRSVAQACPEAAPAMDRLIASASEERHALVHADFSPKNLLHWPGHLLLVDYETGHYGDPAFDLGFFRSHLLLKAARAAPRAEPFYDLLREFEASYRQVMEPAVGQAEFARLLRRGTAHLAGCAWARLDGTSRVDYLDDPARRDAVRTLCGWLLANEAETCDDWLPRARRALADA